MNKIKGQADTKTLVMPKSANRISRNEETIPISPEMAVAYEAMILRTATTLADLMDSSAELKRSTAQAMVDDVIALLPAAAGVKLGPGN